MGSKENSIGIVASGTTHSSMTFYATEGVRTDYVCVEGKGGERQIFEVLQETVQNNRLTDADTIRFMEETDDYRCYNVYICETVPVANLTKEGRPVQCTYSIASPGSRVFRATAEDLSSVYDIAATNGRKKIGSLLRNPDVNIFLNPDELLLEQVHMAVVGRTGSGKSWLTQHFLDMLAMRCIVFSPTDEYNFLNKPHKIVDKKELTLCLDLDMAKRLFNLNATESKFLRNFMSSMELGTYSQDRLLKEMVQFFHKATLQREPVQLSILNNDEDAELSLPQYVTSLIQKLEDYDGHFQKLGDVVTEPENSLIYNFQGCRRTDQERIIYSVLYPLLEHRKAQFSSATASLDPKEHIVIVFEEAQNYVPSNRSTLCKELIVDLARTGRKYGLHILLLSQRPRYIDPTILSQCGGGILFNLPNAEDVEYVMSSASLNRAAPFKRMVQNFDTGECLLLRAEKSHLDLVCRISSFPND